MAYFGHKKKIKKELEYQKSRLISRRNNNFQLFGLFYRSFFYFLAIAFFAILVYSLFFSQFLRINEVKIVGNQKLDSQMLMGVSQEVWNGKYLGIFPKNNFLLFPRGKVNDVLLENFKRIRQIKIEKVFPQSVLVEIVERDLLLVWCDSSNHCFLVDNEGFAYQQVSLDSKEVLENDLLKVTDQESQETSEGDKVLNKEKIEFLVKTRNELKGVDLGVENEFTLSSKLAQEVNLKTQNGWTIFISTEIEPSKTIDFLENFLNRQLSTEEVKQLEYVDLRVENRLYYKLKKDKEKESEESDQDETSLGSQLGNDCA